MATLINIPFGGFYESKWSDLVDSALERESENMEERESSREYYPDEFYPDELRADYSDMWQYMNYRDAYLEIARDYVAGFADMLDEWAKEIDDSAPKSGLKFSRLDSPREYNFRTDEIDCSVNLKFVRWMFRQSKKANHAELRETLIRRHKSRDGFISFYSHNLGDWLSKPVVDYDHNELRSLLESVFPQLNDDSDYWEWSIYESMAENDWQYVNDHFRYADWQAAITEQRAEKFLIWIDDDLDAAKQWAANNQEKFAALMEVEKDLKEWEANNRESLPYRCALTPDLFANLDNPANGGKL